MVSYSLDLRAKVLGAYDRGMTTNAIAEAFGVIFTAIDRVVDAAEAEELLDVPVDAGDIDQSGPLSL